MQICVKKLGCKQIVSLFLRITVTSEEDRRVKREFECLDYPRIQKARGPVQRKLGCCKDKQVCLSSLIWLLSSTFNSILASNWKLYNLKKKKKKISLESFLHPNLLTFPLYLWILSLIRQQSAYDEKTETNLTIVEFQELNFDSTAFKISNPSFDPFSLIRPLNVHKEQFMADEENV